jgi:hypothetical protein
MKGSAFRTGLTGLATALALAGCGSQAASAESGESAGKAAESAMSGTSDVVTTDHRPSTPPLDSQSCPVDQPLAFGADPAAEAADAVRGSVQADHPSAQIGLSYGAQQPAPAGHDYAGIPFQQCGFVIGARTWVVEVHLPDLEPSESLSNVQYFVSRFRDGWRVWGSY